MEDRTESTALIACQGPEALGIIDRLVDSPVTGLRPFSWSNAALSGTPVVLARTGYTGKTAWRLWPIPKTPPPSGEC